MDKVISINKSQNDLLIALLNDAKSNCGIHRNLASTNPTVIEYFRATESEIDDLINQLKK